MAPIPLDANADTLVCVIQKGPVMFKKTEFKVLAAAISASPYWASFIKHMSGAFGFKPNSTHIEDTGITVVSVEIVLRGLHQSYHQRALTRTFASNVEGRADCNEPVDMGEASNTKNEALGSGTAIHADQPPANISTSGETTNPLPEKGGPTSSLSPFNVQARFPPELSKADIDDVWGVLALVNLNFGEHKGKFDVDWSVVRPWFLEWRETTFATFRTPADFQKVLFPTFAFLDPKGFCHATKWLCQNTSVGNIEEYSPLVQGQKTQWYLHLHLPKDVMSWVRIARSKLRTEVSNEIWSIVWGDRGWLSDAKCDCWVVAHYNYLEGLGRAEVLCPELNSQKTVMELVHQMKEAEYEEPLNACTKCSKANIISQLRSAIQVASDCEVVSTWDIPELLSHEQKKLRKKPQGKLPRPRPNHNARN